MKDHISIYVKRNLRRIFLLFVLFIASFIIHKVLSGFEQEIIGSIILILIFSGGFIYDYLSIFRKELPRIEYFLTIFFIIIFTILMFSVIYSEKLRSGNSYFIENGENLSKLTFSDAFYFSAITITTTGYGDILPVGIFRYFVILEVFLGLIYVGTMVYVITRHLDKRN